MFRGAFGRRHCLVPADAFVDRVQPGVPHGIRDRRGQYPNDLTEWATEKMMSPFGRRRHNRQRAGTGR